MYVLTFFSAGHEWLKELSNGDIADTNSKKGHWRLKRWASANYFYAMAGRRKNHGKIQNERDYTFTVSHGKGVGAIALEAD